MGRLRGWAHHRRRRLARDCRPRVRGGAAAAIPQRGASHSLQPQHQQHLHQLHQHRTTAAAASASKRRHRQRATRSWLAITSGPVPPCLRERSGANLRANSRRRRSGWRCRRRRWLTPSPQSRPPRAPRSCRLLPPPSSPPLLPVVLRLRLPTAAAATRPPSPLPLPLPGYFHSCRRCCCCGLLLLLLTTAAGGARGVRVQRVPGRLPRALAARRRQRQRAAGRRVRGCRPPAGACHAAISPPSVPAVLAQGGTVSV